MTAVLCDLDGVLYRGSRLIDGVAEALDRLTRTGMPVFFITNNSTRTPKATAEKIARMTGIAVSADQVITSGQAATTMLGDEDGPVLVVGEDGLRDVVTGAGHVITDDAMLAGAVVVGLTRALDYDIITSAMRAVRNGARFIATNDDTSFPTEDGLAPGCGAIVAAIAAASERAPEVAGKPNPAMRRLIRARVDGTAWVIGDRVDTDIALAGDEEGWESILVLTGITDLDNAAGSGADHVVADFPAAVDLVLDHLKPS